MHKKLTWFVILMITIAGCKTVQQGIFSKQTPHEEYQNKLVQAGLDGAVLGKTWIQAASTGISEATSIEIPFSEALVFDLEHLNAATYMLKLKEGQNLHIMVEPENNDTLEVFIDLFHLNNGELKHTEHAEKDSLKLNYRVKRNGEYLVRIQPELLAQGLFMAYIFTDASLNFPVPEKDFNSIASFFGDPRDGGGRRHEGVDIFAPRGTPALAVGDGRVSRTGTNRLGGKVVWVTDTQRGYNYYYAHLDSQLVRPGMRVNAGDTIGLIGNTGNARTTPPHLHFGIYAMGRRSIDPYVFFHRTELPVIDSLHIQQYAGNWGRTTSPRTNLRTAPGMQAEIDNSLTSGIPLKILGLTNNWLKVELPSGEQGYIYRTLIDPVTKPIEEITVSNQVVRIRPDSEARAKLITDQNETVKVIAEYDSYLLINIKDNFGWIKDQS
ncbi:MAG TPA: peptidoglycan DD-metalloendopeptidase family protein [Mariniphaga sp.]|nr:peptidoglycan DD-metalloendopeptidase family protein [Mariniphaga sp.]